MNTKEQHQVVFEEHPRLFTGSFLQCIVEARERGKAQADADLLAKLAQCEADKQHNAKIAEGLMERVEKLEALERHTELCRKALSVPDNEPMLDSIEALLERVKLMQEQCRVSDEAFNFQLKLANELMEKCNSLEELVKSARELLGSANPPLGKQSLVKCGAYRCLEVGQVV